MQREICVFPIGHPEHAAIRKTKKCLNRSSQSGHAPADITGLLWGFECPAVAGLGAILALLFGRDAIRNCPENMVPEGRTDTKISGDKSVMGLVMLDQS